MAGARLGVPAPSSEAALRRMQRQGRSNTKPELALRSALHRMGFRYRVDCAPVPGMRRRADLVFGPAKVAVYVHGCFWHGCPSHGTWPHRNADWWRAKIEANQRRDADTELGLQKLGWRTVIVWEHDDPAAAAAAIAEVVRGRRNLRRRGNH